MRINSGSSANNENYRKFNWKSFIIFLLLSLILGTLFIYLVFPEFFSEDIIERIPIIIEEQSDEVIHLYGG